MHGVHAVRVMSSRACRAGVVQSARRLHRRRVMLQDADVIFSLCCVAYLLSTYLRYGPTRLSKLPLPLPHPHPLPLPLLH